MDQLIRVLVVDDSAYVRKVVKQMLSRSPFIEVVGTAADGEAALELVEELDPDVVTLDLVMPRLDGVGFLREQMRRRPLPVLVLSIASESGGLALTALDTGAIDFVQKPTALANERVFEISDELIDKVKAAASVGVRNRVAVHSAGAVVAEGRPLVPSLVRATRAEVVVIGISTGGPSALKQLVPALAADFPLPVAIVLHMPVGYTEMYAQRLAEVSALEVVEAREGDLVRPGRVLLAQAGRHLSFLRRPDGTVVVHLDARPFDTPHRPSVDVLFQSASEVYGEGVVALVMTGMGTDGRNGAAWVKAHGGTVVTEAEESCVVYGMPGAVVEAGLSDASAPLDMLPRLLSEVV